MKQHRRTASTPKHAGVEQEQTRLLQVNIFKWVALGVLNAKSSLNLIQNPSLIPSGSEVHTRSSSQSSWWKPPCRAPSHRTSSISSPTIQAVMQPRFTHVSSPPNHGTHEPEGIILLVPASLPSGTRYLIVDVSLPRSFQLTCSSHAHSFDFGVFRQYMDSFLPPR